MFRSSAAVDYRAIRDMGLAAWWGSSLMGLAALVPASESQQDPAARHKVMDAGWRGSRGFLTGAIGAYVVGVGLVRFDGKPFESNGKPRWISEGVECVPRSIAVGTALAASIAAKRLRDKEGKIYEQPMPSHEAIAEAGELRRRAHTVRAVVPIALGWLLFHHIKQDAES